MIYIEDIFSEFFDALRSTSDVINITNVSANTYQITTTSTEHLMKDDYVAFANTSSFTDEGYKVTEIISATEFNVFAKGVTIGTFGTWNSQSWYFLPAKTIEMSNKVTQDNKIDVKRKE